MKYYRGHDYDKHFNFNYFNDSSASFIESNEYECKIESGKS